MDDYIYRRTKRMMEDELLRAKRSLKELEQQRKKHRGKMFGAVCIIVGILLFINLLNGASGTFAYVFFVVPVYFLYFVIAIVTIWLIINIIRYMGESGVLAFAIFWGGKRSSYVVAKKEYLDKIAELEHKIQILEEQGRKEVK